jgi:hypothetical protein
MLFRVSIFSDACVFVLHLLLRLWYKKHNMVSGNCKNYVLYYGIH